VPDDDEDDGADTDDLDEDGDWMLRAHTPVSAHDVAEKVPEPLLPWVRRMTRDAAGWMADLAESERDFAAAAERLHAESEALE
jgi:hypothetical protein